jgi:hypothetical protein
MPPFTVIGFFDVHSGRRVRIHGNDGLIHQVRYNASFRCIQGHVILTDLHVSGTEDSTIYPDHTVMLVVAHGIIPQGEGIAVMDASSIYSVTDFNDRFSYMIAVGDVIQSGAAEFLLRVTNDDGETGFIRCAVLY